MASPVVFLPVLGFLGAGRFDPTGAFTCTTPKLETVLDGVLRSYTQYHLNRQSALCAQEPLQVWIALHDLLTALYIHYRYTLPTGTCLCRDGGGTGGIPVPMKTQSRH